MHEPACNAVDQQNTSAGSPAEIAEKHSISLDKS
jgi:hypothetical protein